LKPLISLSGAPAKTFENPWPSTFLWYTMSEKHYLGFGKSTYE